MLEAAREHARQQGVAMRLVHSKVEEAPEDLGGFHLLTIGQSHWYIHTPATLVRIERWLLPGGRILICRPIASAIGSDTWHDEFRSIRQRWARGDTSAKLRLTADEFLAGADFVRLCEVVALGQRSVELEHLVHRALGTAERSAAALGPDTDAMIAEIRARMAPYFSNGPLTEQLITSGLLYRRRGDI